MGNGAALTIMDRTSYSNKKLVDFMYKTAKDKNIPVQYKQTATGGNDAGKIQLTVRELWWHRYLFLQVYTFPCVGNEPKRL